MAHAGNDETAFSNELRQSGNAQRPGPADVEEEEWIGCSRDTGAST